MTNLEKMLRLVRDEQITFAEFVTKTRTEFERMARHLLRRWASPEWFTIDDLVQELYVGAWKYIWRYDPKYGVSLARYIVFNSMSAAKAHLHKSRGVTISGSPDKKVSNIESPISSLGESGEAIIDSILSTLPAAEELLIEEEERSRAVQKALFACETPKERYAVLAIREAGGLDDAGRVLYDDIDHRIDLRLHSEEHADRFILRQARAIALRLDAVNE